MKKVNCLYTHIDSWCTYCDASGTRACPYAMSDNLKKALLAQKRKDEERRDKALDEAYMLFEKMLELEEQTGELTELEVIIQYAIDEVAEKMKLTSDEKFMLSEYFHAELGS